MSPLRRLLAATTLAALFAAATPARADWCVMYIKWNEKSQQWEWGHEGDWTCRICPPMIGNGLGDDLDYVLDQLPAGMSPINPSGGSTGSVGSAGSAARAAGAAASGPLGPVADAVDRVRDAVYAVDSIVGGSDAGPVITKVENVVHTTLAPVVTTVDGTVGTGTPPPPIFPPGPGCPTGFLENEIGG